MDGKPELAGRPGRDNDGSSLSWPERKAAAALGKAASDVDERFGAANFARNVLQKVFPDHWSFLLGEIALYSFIILLLTGTFLTLFFKPSMTEIISGLSVRLTVAP